MAQPRGPWLYRLVGLTTRILLRLFARAQVTGVDHVPPTGPLVVMANHRHISDPVLLGATFPRFISFMAKEEVFRGWAGVILRWYGAFPVRRGRPDRAALKKAMETLDRQGALGLFPEGTRSRSGALLPVHPGAGLLVRNSGATAIPVAIMGSEQFTSPLCVFRRPELKIQIGEAVSPSSLSPEAAGHLLTTPARPSHRDLAEEMMRRIAAMLPPEQRGAYR